jgi:hypothetical protein
MVGLLSYLVSLPRGWAFIFVSRSVARPRNRYYYYYI